MVKVEQIDDAISLVTDPRFTQQPAAEFPSGHKLPDPERLAGGPMATFALAGIAWRFLVGAYVMGRR
jgi:hypothetical protein